ncbi:MAG: hypothetical protein KKC20_05190 [Proteobacteria bacterium]|nr:hypothetical protein [Pseudomonadota bacterium]
MSLVRNTRQIAYGLTLFFIALSGFAQMPIFKRYYIADIPGLGWLDQFYVTHVLHYGFAAFFIGFSVYAGLDFVLTKKKISGLTASGLVKIALIVGLMVSGGLMVAKNLPGIYFPHALIYVINISHLGLCMVLLMVSAYTLVRKKAWIK